MTSVVNIRATNIKHTLIHKWPDDDATYCYDVLVFL